VSADYSDLFCELFDRLSPAEFHANVEGWLADQGVLAGARAVESAALAGTLSATSAAESAPFALLLGLDAALAHANPALGGTPPQAIAEYALRYAESGRLDSGARPGALLPRFATPGRRGQLPNDVADAFSAVVRVGATDWEECDHGFLPAHARLAPADRERGLRVATAPMIREPAELSWRVLERGDLRFYRIHPSGSEATRRRIERVIAAWDDHDVTIGVVPELCLSPELLEEWRRALRGRERASSIGLRLVLAGTGDVDRESPPANTAVLLDALTGETLATQRKLHPFNFSETDLELWQLDDRLSAPIDEDLRRGDRLCVIEAGGVRLAMLVCEDLARLHTFAAALHAHGVSLILVPVFARPTKDRRWERSRAEVYSDSIGSTVVVANSLVMASILGSDTPVGTALAVAPGQASVGHASEPDDVVVFAFDGDGPRVVHERTA
jgi:predicted amidohydrolase